MQYHGVIVTMVDLEYEPSLELHQNTRKKDLNIQIVHRGRSANFVADTLAKHGLLRQEEFIASL